MDLSKISTEDLVALKMGDLTRVSTGGLKEYKRQLRLDVIKQKNPGEYDPASPEFKAKYGATSAMSGPEKFAAGYGKATVDLGRGLGQYAGLVSRQDVADSRSRDAELMGGGAAKAGNIINSVAMFAPTAAIPGANTVAGAAAVGAGIGAAQPSVSTGETIKNIGLGGALSAGSLLAARGASALYRGGKAVVEPLTKKGQERIAARTLEAYAGGRQNAQNAAANIARESADVLPGYRPTTAELSNNGGLSQLERTVRNNPEFLSDFVARDQGNKNAIVGALNTVAKGDAELSAAQASRGAVADDLYGQAIREGADANLTSQVNRRMAEQEAARKLADAAKLRESTRFNWQGSAGGRPVSGNPIDDLALQKASALEASAVVPEKTMLSGVDVSDLMERPAIRTAFGSAKNIAANMGRKLDTSNPVEMMHYAKLALDAQISEAKRAGAGSAVMEGLQSSKAALLRRIEEISPGYIKAKDAFAAMSRPINQMEVGQALRNKLLPALDDFGPTTRLRPEAFAQAMRDGDTFAANTLGNPGARMADVLTPDQFGTLNAVGRTLSRRTSAAELGKALGSNTGQNIVSQNVVRQFLGPLGLPESTMQRAAESALLQTVMRPIGFVGKIGEQRAMGLLAEAALEPKVAAELLRIGVPPEKIGLLRFQGLLGPTAASGTNAAKQ